MTADWRLAVDIGGTFTDIVLFDAASGRVVVDKTLTTPSAPLDGVRTGVTQLLGKAGVRPADITAPIVHATTLITNALIEGKIGRAGIVTTAGFGDTLLIRNEHRYDMYDLQIEFPAPPVPRDRVVELAERTDPQGHALEAPTAEGLAAITEQLRAAKVEAVGVCLINSYANPANERIVAEHLRTELGVPVCISSEISPQIREYPRMITTACNAATMPVIGPYLDELQKWLAAEGFGGSVLMMLSNGGVVSADDAARAPIRLVESGPAAGALAGSWFARRIGEDRLLCFDMGGTTAKSCLIVDGEPELTNTFEVARIYRFKKGSGFPVSVPSVDLVEIGAGGGSQARRRRARPAEGRTRVGRRRSRARLLRARWHEARGHRRRPQLGMLDASFFLGGDMPLDMAACTSALESVAARSGLGRPTLRRRHPRARQPEHGRRRAHARGRAGRRPARHHRPRVRRCRSGPRVWRGRAARVAPRGVPRERERAVGVRHARQPGAHRPRPQHGPLARRSSTPPSATHCSTNCAPKVAACSPPPASTTRRSASATASTPATSGAGQRDHHLGRRGRRPLAHHRRRGHRGCSTPTTSRIYGLTIPDVGVEAVTWRLSAYAPAASVEPTAVVGTEAGAPHPHPPGPLLARRHPQSTRRSTAVPELGSEQARRRPGDRRRARDDRGHPSRLDRLGRSPTVRCSPNAAGAASQEGAAR
jgi:hypothetical protein